MRARETILDTLTEVLWIIVRFCTCFHIIPRNSSKGRNSGLGCDYHAQLHVFGHVFKGTSDEAEMAAMLEFIVGWREVTSVAGMSWPGTWVIVKHQGRVLCFRRNMRGLLISPRALFPRVLTRGPSMAAIFKSLQPKVKKLVSSRAHIKANASPSISA